MNEKLNILNIDVPINTLGVEINNFCQLNCNYCWTKQNFYTSKNKNEISLEDIQKRLDLIFYTKEKNQQKNYTNIIFCAKEPLLSWNKIKQLWEKNKKLCLKYNINFEILSNGLALNNEIVEYCIKEKIFLSISLDGKTSHDKQRRDVFDNPTYEKIKEKLKQVPKMEPVIINLLFTVSKESIDNLAEDLWDLLEIHPQMLIAIGTDNSSFDTKDWEKFTSLFLTFYKSLPKKLQERICIKKYFFENSYYSLDKKFSLYLENDNRLHITYPLGSTIIRKLSTEEEYIFNSDLTQEIYDVFIEKYYKDLKINFSSEKCNNNCELFNICNNSNNSNNKFIISNIECNSLKNWYKIWREINDYT